MIVAIIPARFASPILMGNPLADIGGKPLIQRTYESVVKSKLIDDVFIALDDERVLEVVEGFGAHTKFTPHDLPSALDRVSYAVRDIQAEIFVIVYGNQPFLDHCMIDEVIEPLLFDKEVQITTLAKKIDKVEELKSSSIVKIVFDYNNFALYFSRGPIPFVNNARTNLAKINTGEMYKNLGFFAFRKKAIKNFYKLERTDLELIENLEHLRFLENGYRIKIVTTDRDNYSVSTQRDLEIARDMFYKLNK